MTPRCLFLRYHPWLPALTGGPALPRRTRRRAQPTPTGRQACRKTCARSGTQVDEAYMLLSQDLSLRSDPSYSALRRELIGRAEANKAAARALRSAR